MHTKPRVCGHCGQMFEGEMIHTGARWVCRPCFDLSEQAEIHRTGRDLDDIPDKDGLTPAEKRRMLEQVVAARRFFDGAMGFAPFAIYLLLYVWGEKAKLGLVVFSGYLLADFFSWAVIGVLEAAERWKELLLEFGLYLLVFQLWRAADGQFALPPDPSDRGVVALLFMAVFGTKMGAWAFGRFNRP